MVAPPVVDDRVSAISASVCRRALIDDTPIIAHTFLHRMLTVTFGWYGITDYRTNSELHLDAMMTSFEQSIHAIFPVHFLMIFDR